MTVEANLDRKVLVVEDEPDLRELLTYNLTAAGFNVQATENGPTAWPRCRSSRPTSCCWT